MQEGLLEITKRSSYQRINSDSGVVGEIYSYGVFGMPLIKDY